MTLVAISFDGISDPIYAGDDPVDQSDPTGECVSVFGIVCLGPGPSNGLNWDAAADSSWQTLKDFATGFVGNAEPACSNGWESLAYEDGNVAWWVGSLGGLLDGVTGGVGVDDGNEGGLPDLEVSQSQLEAKFTHASDFGVTESRGASGFQAYGKALNSFVGDAGTVRVVGTYRGNPAILNYNPSTAQVVVQSPAGGFISGWQMSPAQLQNVISRGSLGGG